MILNVNLSVSSTQHLVKILIEPTLYSSILHHIHKAVSHDLYRYMFVWFIKYSPTFSDCYQVMASYLRRYGDVQKCPFLFSISLKYIYIIWAWSFTWGIISLNDYAQTTFLWGVGHCSRVCWCEWNILILAAFLPILNTFRNLSAFILFLQNGTRKWRNSIATIYLLLWNSRRISVHAFEFS